MLNHSLPTAVAPVNPEPASPRELHGLRDAFALVNDIVHRASCDSDAFDPPAVFWQAMGRLEAYVNAITAPVGGVPYSLALYEPEPFEPSAEESQWAAENVTPCAVPTTPDGLLSLVADSLESLGLEPTLHPDAIDFDAIGREFRLQLQDMTAYYSHMQREYERFHGLTEGESQALAAGLAL